MSYPIRIIQQPRNSGKTQNLVKYSAASGATIVTWSSASRKSILEYASDLGEIIPDPILFDDFMTRRFKAMKPWVKSIVFDDFGSNIQNYTGVKVEVIVL